MARRYTYLPGVGRCAVTLEGHDDSGRVRAWIYQAVETKRVYLVTRRGRCLEARAVAARSPAAVLETMSDLDWAVALSSPVDESWD